MQGLAATAVSEYALCPLRAHLRVDAPANLETSAFNAIVRRALQLAAHVRIEKEAYELSFVVRKLMRERGLDDDIELFERARSVTRSGLQTLFEFTPKIVDAPFTASIAGMSVRGTVDLIARRADGAVFVFAFTTGDVPDSSFAIELALAKCGMSEAYPGATYVVLYLDDDGAVLREPVLPDRASLERFVLDALERSTEEPRPGAYCRACDFLARCPLGRHATP